MCEPRAPYGSVKTGPLAQKIESSIDPGQEVGCIRIVVDVFPRQGLQGELLDEVTALYSKFLENLHRMRATDLAAAYPDNRVA